MVDILSCRDAVWRMLQLLVSFPDEDSAGSSAPLPPGRSFWISGAVALRFVCAVPFYTLMMEPVTFPRRSM